MKRCPSFPRYKGLHRPKCDGGRGCDDCWEYWACVRINKREEEARDADRKVRMDAHASHKWRYSTDDYGSYQGHYCENCHMTDWAQDYRPYKVCEGKKK